MLTADISTAVTDMYTTETIAPAKMLRLIAAAVRYYSRWNPYVVKSTFTTVADQEAYDLAAGTLLVLDVLWPSDTLSGVVNVGQEQASALILNPASRHLVSEKIIKAIQDDSFYTGMLGRWRVENKQVILSPTPGSTGSDVEMWCAALHAINVGSTAYTTIPGEDLEIMRDLVVAEIIQGRAIEMSAEPDYKEGLSSETFHFATASANETVRMLRRRCSDRYSGVAVGSSGWPV